MLFAVCRNQVANDRNEQLPKTKTNFRLAGFEISHTSCGNAQSGRRYL